MNQKYYRINARLYDNESDMPDCYGLLNELIQKLEWCMRIGGYVCVDFSGFWCISPHFNRHVFPKLQHLYPVKFLQKHFKVEADSITQMERVFTYVCEGY